MDWIRTRVMLPPFDKEVLVMDKNGYIFTGLLSRGYDGTIGWRAFTPKDKPGCGECMNLWDISWWQEFWGRPQGGQFHEIAQAIVDNLGKSVDTEDDDTAET